MRVEVFASKKGDMSASVTYFDTLTRSMKTVNICSRFNPVEEGRRWALEAYEEDKEIYLVYGLGLGYHIGELEKLLNVRQKIVVLETNIEVSKRLRPHISKSLFESLSINIHITNDINQIKNIFNNIHRQKVKFIIHEVLIKIIPEEMQLLKEVLENYQFRQNTVIAGKYTELIKENYSYFDKQIYPNISSWYNKHKGKPLIIVAGGPSLDKNIDILCQVKEEVFIFPVARVLKMLLSRGIKPDMFCTIDAQYELTAIHIEGVEDQDIPMVFLNTASHYTVEKYNGPKYIAYSMDSPKSQEGRIESGGSVATAVLDLAIRFGANPIIFVGQDLAYSNNLSHATETNNLYKVEESKVMARVEDINGECILTSQELLGFKYFIENKIRQNANIKFYNCTEGGAYIKGCKHQALDRTLEELKILK